MTTAPQNNPVGLIFAGNAANNQTFCNPIRAVLSALLQQGDDFAIKDADGHDAYHVDGKVLSFGDKLSFHDMGGNELTLVPKQDSGSAIPH